MTRLVLGAKRHMSDYDHDYEVNSWSAVSPTDPDEVELPMVVDLCKYKRAVGFFGHLAHFIKPPEPEITTMLVSRNDYDTFLNTVEEKTARLFLQRQGVVIVNPNVNTGFIPAVANAREYLRAYSDGLLTQLSSASTRFLQQPHWIDLGYSYINALNEIRKLDSEEYNEAVKRMCGRLTAGAAGSPLSDRFTYRGAVTFIPSYLSWFYFGTTTLNDGQTAARKSLPKGRLISAG